MHLSVLSAHILVYYMHACSLWKPEKGFGVINEFEPSYELWELNLGPLEVVYFVCLFVFCFLFFVFTISPSIMIIFSAQ
jgi:hypothetical protein